MPPVVGNYSKGVRGGFDEAERLQLGFMRTAIPVVDADENRKEYIRYTWLRRALETVIGDASPNDGFKAVGDGAANDLLITGGDGTLNGAGRMWVRGMHAFLMGDIRYVNAGASADELACLPTIAYITGVGNVVLEDSAASYVPGSLVGRNLVPDVTLGVVTPILANTATTITVGIDLIVAGIAVGARYRVNMSTPAGSGRNDGLYLNVSMDEVDGTEVPSILHNLGTLMAAQFFGQIRHTLEVHQGDTPGLPGALATSYVDVDGFEHFRVKLADITRFDGVAAIAAPDVTDLRATSANFSTFLKKTGDNMSGDLNMLVGADINLAVGGAVDGRDVSVDGAKLDTITWTAAGVAALLPKVRQRVAGTAVNMTAATKNVSQHLRDKVPGGTPTVKGVVTVAPDNDVLVRRNLDKDAIVDVNLNGVFGRLTESHPFPTLSGTWTFTNAAFTVFGSGGSALTQLQVGDIVQGPDGLYYTVALVTGNNNFTIVEPFAGATGNIPSPPARRYVLTLRVNAEGVESDFNPVTEGVAPGAVDIDWYYHEVFDYATKPAFDPAAGQIGDQLPPEIPAATTAIAGKVALAPDLGTGAGTAVQGSDQRLGRAKGRVGGTLTALKSEVELVAGSGITVAIAEVGDKMVFTIANAAPGGGTSFPGFSGATPQPDSVVGGPGGTGLASDAGHSHPLGSVNQLRSAANTFTAATNPTFAPGFSPRAVIVVAHVNEGGTQGASAGASDGTTQGAIRWAGTLDLGTFGSGQILSGAAGSTWGLTSFTSAAVTLTRGAGTGVLNGVMLVLGDSVP